MCQPKIKTVMRFKMSQTFKYLGSIININGDCAEAIRRRLAMKTQIINRFKRLFHDNTNS